MISVLFVCIGNICRSPAAEEILRQLAKQHKLELEIQSCGLGDWHVGNLPDIRMRESAKKRGFILNSRAQKFEVSFFDRFDFILVVDTEILNKLSKLALTEEQKAKIQLITHFSTSYHNQKIPDPYYEGDAGFERVLDMLEDSCEGILSKITKV